ncbi:extracellular solute-binding protein [Spirochaeta isovalerica]|uniref:Multiple sugar transport system substrate-binding protein n=1 Tax=Spirochaeta isovalerica TaxID=150 RepID=A0A841RIJ1_9SPIO|nr:extracellular solute-binding protein [Spirochaeta isovalerica]MBB6482122.1 multiple sugar transport system substrate-binding protein [Spirochaeta isovalerica]
MKKTLMIFLSLAVLALPLLAGGAQEEEGPITIKFWTHEDPNRTTIEERYIAEFEASHPGITIERVTNSSAKMPELLLTAFAANEGPHIFNTQIEDGYAYIANGRVAPIDPVIAGFKSNDELRDSYVKGVLDAVSEDGNIYGLPLELTNWAPYINKRIFRDAGLDPEKDYPRTWEDIVAVSEKIVKREGQIITRRGFDFRYPYYLVSVVPMVEQLGGKLISDDGKTAIVGDDAWLKLLQFMADWGPSGLNLGSPTYKNARKLFNADNNDMAMAMSGLYQEGRIRADNPEFYESGDWMVIPFPQFENAVKEVASAYYGHFYMVNSQKPEREQKAAWEFITYMLSHSEEYLTEVGLIQPTKKLMSSSTFASIPYADVFASDMEKGNIVYYAENSAKIQELIKEAIEGVMLSGISPEKALASLKVKAQEVLDQE